MEGFTGATGEPLFLCFFDTAGNVAIGEGSTQFGKTIDFCQKFSFAKLYGFCQIVCGFAKRFAKFVLCVLLLDELCYSIEINAKEGKINYQKLD